MNPIWEYLLSILNLRDESDENRGQILFAVACGYRFSPHKYELLVYYLAKKILGLELPADIIMQFDDLFKFDPDQLPIDEFKAGKPKEAYFFTNRAPNETEMIITHNGYWRVVVEGEDEDGEEEEEIVYKNHVIGFMKTYVFHEGKAPSGVETPWVLREFRFNAGLIPSELLTEDVKAKMDTFVVCRIIDTSYESKFRVEVPIEEE